VSSKDQAFFGAKEEHLPELDDIYLGWVLDSSPFNGHLSLAVLREGFEMFGRRPEYLQALLGDLQRDSASDHATLNDVFVQRTAERLALNRKAFMSALRAMDALDAAVFRRMALLGERFTPFDQSAMVHYQRLMQESDPVAAVERPTKSAVQAALERLRRDAFVWNAGRGLWYIEDTQHTAWMLSGEP
jgi:hypothetical protein